MGLLVMQFLDNLSLALVKLSPALSQWIQIHIPAEKQHEMDMRMRRCYRHIKHWSHNKPTDVLVSQQVSLDFNDADLNNMDRMNISELICDWLSIPYTLKPSA